MLAFAALYVSMLLFPLWFYWTVHLTGAECCLSLWTNSVSVGEKRYLFAPVSYRIELHRCGSRRSSAPAVTIMYQTCSYCLLWSVTICTVRLTFFGVCHPPVNRHYHWSHPLLSHDTHKYRIIASALLSSLLCCSDFPSWNSSYSIHWNLTFFFFPTFRKCATGYSSTGNSSDPMPRCHVSALSFQPALLLFNNGYKEAADWLLQQTSEHDGCLAILQVSLEWWKKEEALCSIAFFTFSQPATLLQVV